MEEEEERGPVTPRVAIKTRAGQGTRLFAGSMALLSRSLLLLLPLLLVVTGADEEEQQGQPSPRVSYQGSQLLRVVVPQSDGHDKIRETFQDEEGNVPDPQHPYPLAPSCVSQRRWKLSPSCVKKVIGDGEALHR